MNRLKELLLPVRSYFYHGTCFSSLPENIPSVYLTFDDGPSPEMTPLILEILKRKKVKATFFLNGVNVDIYPHVAKTIFDQGHEIGNHAYTHRWLIFKSSKFLANQIEKTQNAFKKAGISASIFFRPPYGISFWRLPKILKQYNLITAFWNVDSLDWNRPPTDKIYNNVIENLKPGSIILFHDGRDICENTLTALNKIIDYIHDQDFNFELLSKGYKL